MDKRITCPLCKKFKESTRKTCGRPNCVSRWNSLRWTDKRRQTPAIKKYLTYLRNNK